MRKGCDGQGSFSTLHEDSALVFPEPDFSGGGFLCILQDPVPPWPGLAVDGAGWRAHRSCLRSDPERIKSNLAPTMDSDFKAIQRWIPSAVLSFSRRRTGTG